MMREVKEKLGIHLRLIKGSPKVCGILLFGITAFLLYFVFLIFIGMDMFHLLSFVAKVNYMFCALLLITTYLLMINSKNSQQDEVIESLDKGVYSYQKYLFFIFIIGLLLINLIMVIVMVLLSLNHSYFILHFMKPYLYNILVPQLICLLLAFVLSLFNNCMISIIISIVFIFMISPFSEMSWPIQPSFPIDKIYQMIHLPFEIFYQNGEWGVDILYGLQCEMSRLWMFVLWFSMLITVYLIKMNKQPLSQSKIYQWGYKISIIIIAGSCFMMCIPECKYRINEAWDGYNYDIYQNKQPTLLKSDKVDYKISDYDLNIKTQRMLHVEGKLHLQSSTLQKDFVLTLYQNYQVIDLKGSQNLTYQRDGDYIYIQFDQPIQEADLTILYEGYHPRFYSNSQATMLPGYFPWYPMCGERQIFIMQEISFDEEHTQVLRGYNVNNRIEDANMIIRADKEYISNLNEKQDHVYEGRSDSISLFSGYIEKTDYKNIINYLAMNGTMKTMDKYLSGVYNTYMKEIDLIENVFDVSLEVYKSKKIIDVSEDINRSMNFGQIAIFNDYVIVSQISDVINLLEPIIQTSSKVTPLIFYLSQIRVQDDSEKTYQGFIEQLDMEEAQQLKQSLENVYKKIGAKRLLHELYEYAFDDSEAHDQKFLERLESL